MIALVVRRLVWVVPVVWAAATLVWIFMFLIPGDPARLLAGQNADPDVLARVRAEWGLDDPAGLRYARYLGRLIAFDLGTSYVHHEPVATLILTGFAHTLFLAATATALSAVLGIGLALLSAARPGGAWDGIARLASTAGLSVPTFWLGLMLILVFSSRLRWLPGTGYGEGMELGGIRFPGAAHLVLPSLTLAFGSAGYVARVARASLLEEAGRPYARAALARGLTSRAVLARHLLANAMLPVVTTLGLHFGHLLGGAVATETIFGWPGLGLVIYRALGSRDLPVVEGGVLLLTAVFLLVSLTVDLTYGLLDPRTRT